MIRMICTGRPSHGGIASSINRYYPEAFFVSRRNGYDLTTDIGYNKFKESVKNYNVFINHSHIKLGLQENLLRDVFNIWSEENIQGHIITIGSVIELEEWKTLDLEIAKEKLSTRNTGLMLNCESIKTTHIITSGFDRYGPEKDIKLKPDKIVEIIKFILESDIDIPLIFIEKTNDDRIKKWRILNNSSF